MGATSAAVFRLITRDLSFALVGIVGGLVCAIWLSRSLSVLLYGVSPTDGATLIGSASVVLMVAVFASWRPAWRATRADPMTILRTE